MRNEKPVFVTSFTFPEKQSLTDRWGASSSPNLIPFQVLAKEADSRTSTRGRVQHYNEGITLTKIESLNGLKESELLRINVDSPGWSLRRSNIWFRPNPVITEISPLMPLRSPYQGAPMNDLPWLPSISCKGPGSMWLACICFVAIDIDFKETPREIADKLIKTLPVQPSTLVMSGNGYHLYFSLKHIPLVLKQKFDFEVDLINSYYYEDRLKKLTLSISKRLGGDARADKNVLGLLRVPGTINYKVINGRPNIAECEYVYGDLCEDYQSPKYTFEQLAEVFCPELIKCKSAIISKNIKAQHKPMTRPRRNTDHWIMAYANFQNYFGIKSSLKQSLKKYFKYAYSHRDLDYYLENPSKKYGARAGLASPYRERAREIMLNLKVIEKVSEHDRHQHKSCKYKITPLFFQACGIEKSTSNNYDLGTYGPGELRTKLTKDFNRLKEAGKAPTQIRETLQQKLSEREYPQPDQEEYLDWLLENASSQQSLSQAPTQ